MAATCEEINGKALNLGGDCVISLKDLAELLVEINRDGDFVVHPFPKDRKKIDIGDYYSEDSQLRALLGWEPQATLQDGLARTLDFYSEHLEHYL